MNEVDFSKARHLRWPRSLRGLLLGMLAVSVLLPQASWGTASRLQEGPPRSSSPTTSMLQRPVSAAESSKDARDPNANASGAVCPRFRDRTVGRWGWVGFPWGSRLFPSRLSRVRNWAFAIGRDLDGATMRLLPRYDLVVVDGEAVTQSQVRVLKASGVIVLGYLSVGTIERNRSWYGEVRAYRLDLWGDWDEWYADAGAPGYRDVIERQVAPSMLAKGLDGLFLDNTDMIESHPAQSEGMRLLVAALSAQTHTTGKWLFTQNGIDSIAPSLACYDGWNLEDVTWSYDFDTGRYVRRSRTDIAAGLRALRRVRAKGLLTLSTDYVKKGNRRATTEAVRKARSVGAIPFVSNIWLTRLPPPPR